MATKLRVYSKRQAGNINGKWDKKTSKVLKSRMTMTDDYAKQLNSGFKNSGVYYAINEKADKKFQEAKAEARKAKKE